MDVRRILVLSPHPDDAELGCGGTLARLLEERPGASARILTLSDCQGSVESAYALAEEANDASQMFPRCGRHWMLFNVRHFPAQRQAILNAIIAERDDFEPDLVFCPSLSDVHQDHETVAREAFRAFKRVPVLGYCLPWNNRSFDHHVYVKLGSRHLEQKINACAKYQTQVHRPYMDSTYLSALARVHGASCGTNFAEVFELIRAVL